ncbi:MAG: hypothetical protein LV481_02510 [Methylacidiphilales bacterium]|nr:hypothetical protein [Candidatus Methylacidiphilales bacterium]
MRNTRSFGRGDGVEDGFFHWDGRWDTGHGRAFSRGELALIGTLCLGVLREKRDRRLLKKAVILAELVEGSHIISSKDVL